MKLGEHKMKIKIYRRNNKTCFEQLFETRIVYNSFRADKRSGQRISFYFIETNFNC